MSFESAETLARRLVAQGMRETLHTHHQEIIYFVMRLLEERLSPDEKMIVVFHVDEPLLAGLSQRLLPDFDWEEARKSGDRGYCVGLAQRPVMQEVLDRAAPVSGARLRAIPGGIAVLVLDHGGALVTEVLVAQLEGISGGQLS